MKLQRNAFCTFFSDQEMKQTFCLFHFPNLLLVEKKNENALKHVLISSNCTKHIQAGNIKVFCGYVHTVSTWSWFASNQISCSYAQDF